MYVYRVWGGKNQTRLSYVFCGPFLQKILKIIFYDCGHKDKYNPDQIHYYVHIIIIFTFFLLTLKIYENLYIFVCPSEYCGHSALHLTVSTDEAILWLKSVYLLLRRFLSIPSLAGAGLGWSCSQGLVINKMSKTWNLPL